MTDEYLFITQHPLFKDRFTIISDVKLSDHKLVLLTYDYNNERICICKIKFSSKYKKEIEVYNKIKDVPHVNIEKVYEIILSDDFYIILIEYIDGLNLTKYTKCKNKDLVNIYENILLGMKYLQQHNIIHGDLKLENIMINGSGNVIIIDFEYAQITDGYVLSENSYGTKNYISPESYDLGVYSKYSDLWSLGVILYKLITDIFPYKLKINQSISIRKYYKNIDLELLGVTCRERKYDKTIVLCVKKMLEFVDKKREIGFSYDFQSFDHQ